MRDSSKRWKNNDFPHIPYYHIPEHFTSEEKKNKKISSGSFFKKNGFGLYATVFLVYYAFCGVRRSVSICGVRWGPLECDDTPQVRCHMSMRGGKSPERRILGHNSPNSTTERMLVVVV